MVNFYPIFSKKNNQAGFKLDHAIGTDAPLGYAQSVFSSCRIHTAIFLTYSIGGFPGFSMCRKLTKDRGFTLLEILFSTMIVGVLSAIAIPIYKGHIDKMNINNAIADINFIQICIERHYTETFQYPPTITDIVTCLPNNGTDPWGKAYVYLNLIDEEKVKGKDKPKGEDKGDDKKRRDHKENPINTLYDL
jgi:general secretion pathway protein G